MGEAAIYRWEKKDNCIEPVMYQWIKRKLYGRSRYPSVEEKAIRMRNYAMYQMDGKALRIGKLVICKRNKKRMKSCCISNG